MTDKIDKLLEGAHTEFDVMRILAPRLAGRQVIVKIATPKTTGSFGEMYVNQDGIPVITTMPYLDGLDTFLHEVAHARLHADQMIKSDLDQARPRSYIVNKMENQPSWEDQADELRDQWLEYGKAHAPDGYSEDGGIMVALMTYYTT